MQRRFVPSQDGFMFVNSWPSQPAVVRPTPLGTLTLGDAAAGLCGGMVFASLDYWRSGTPPPSRRPEAGHPLYGFLVHRLVDSWCLPVGVAQYYRWMRMPDGDASLTLLGRPVRGRRGLAWRTVVQQWPRISTELDRGVPVPLGVVTVASADPRNLAHNHQVLACGYETTSARTTIQVYDPNRGRRDDIFVSFDSGAPAGPTTFEHNLGIGQRRIRGFFRTAYTPARVPGA